MENKSDKSNALFNLRFDGYMCKLANVQMDKGDLFLRTHPNIFVFIQILFDLQEETHIKIRIFAHFLTYPHFQLIILKVM